MTKSDYIKVLEIIRDAGGMIVGRTKLQKVACLLEIAGVGESFYFSYYHYGPYCEELTWAVDTAKAMGKVKETEKRANWGGIYSVYTVEVQNDAPQDSVRTRLARAAANANSIILELAVTAAYFAKNGSRSPWKETARYKPDKAEGGRLDEAKKLYQKFRLIAPKLPEIIS